MNRHNHDRNPKQQQAQDAVPHERLHVNGAGEDGAVSPAGGGKGGGNKSPPGNGKAPPPGNGADGGRNLPERVAVLETEHKHLATKADLEQGLSGLRKEIHDVRDDLTDKIHATELRLVEKAQENKEELRKEAQENKEELAKKIEEGRAETRRMPYVILVGLAALMTVAAFAPEAIEWLRGMLG